jgi:hypothetical protein
MFLKKRKSHINNQLSGNYSINITNHLEYVYEFLQPFTINENTQISEFIYNKVLKLIEINNNNSKHITRFNNTVITNTLFNIHLEETNIIKSYPITTNTNAINLQENLNSIKTIQKAIAVLKIDLDNLQNNTENILLNKKNENKYKYELDYCKKTMLLNVDKLKNTLNNDVISYIKSFLDPEFLETVRISAIRNFRFSNPKKQVKCILKKMTTTQLIHFCKNKLYLLYDLEDFPDNLNIFNIPNTMNIHMHFDAHDVHTLFDTNILYRRKKYIIKNILKKINVINYFPFQKELYFIDKFITESNTKRIEKRLQFKNLKNI